MGDNPTLEWTREKYLIFPIKGYLSPWFVKRKEGKIMGLPHQRIGDSKWSFVNFFFLNNLGNHIWGLCKARKLKGNRGGKSFYKYIYICSRHMF